MLNQTDSSCFYIFFKALMLQSTKPSQFWKNMYRLLQFSVKNCTEMRFALRVFLNMKQEVNVS